MTINVEHLLDQVDELTKQTVPGAPRQADLCRAVSTAYYALFHTLLTALADEFVGVTARRSPRYRLVYRSLAHERARRVCREVVKVTPSKEYHPYWPEGGFGSVTRGFAEAFVIQARHDADYDPHYRLSLSDAKLLIAKAKAAIRRMHGATPSDRKLLLTLMLCEPRSA